MAVTHADLAPSPKSTELGSKAGAFLMVVSILLGLFCFILCLVAEATRSEMKWSTEGGRGIESRCMYTGSGKVPLASASVAFLTLAVAMAVQHTYLLVAITNSNSLVELSWVPDSDFAKSLTWQAGFFFVTTWLSFAVGEILLLIGVSVESGHLKNWAMPRPSCLTLGPGLFTAAGVFGLLTAFLASGLYITALRAENYCHEKERTRRVMLEAAAMYASPPLSPARAAIMAAPQEGPLQRQDQNQGTLCQHSTTLDKQIRLA